MLSLCAGFGDTYFWPGETLLPGLHVPSFFAAPHQMLKGQALKATRSPANAGDKAKRTKESLLMEEKCNMIGDESRFGLYEGLNERATFKLRLPYQIYIYISSISNRIFVERARMIGVGACLLRDEGGQSGLKV